MGTAVRTLRFSGRQPAPGMYSTSGPRRFRYLTGASPAICQYRPTVTVTARPTLSYTVSPTIRGTRDSSRPEAFRPVSSAKPVTGPYEAISTQTAYGTSVFTDRQTITGISQNRPTDTLCKPGDRTETFQSRRIMTATERPTSRYCAHPPDNGTGLTVQRGST